MAEEEEGPHSSQEGRKLCWNTTCHCHQSFGKTLIPNAGQPLKKDLYYPPLPNTTTELCTQCFRTINKSVRFPGLSDFRSKSGSKQHSPILRWAFFIFIVSDISVPCNGRSCPGYSRCLSVLVQNPAVLLTSLISHNTRESCAYTLLPIQTSCLESGSLPQKRRTP